MEQLRNKVMEIITNFGKQEIGNKLSEFSMLALQALVNNEFASVMNAPANKPEPKKDK